MMFEDLDCKYAVVRLIEGSDDVYILSVHKTCAEASAAEGAAEYTRTMPVYQPWGYNGPPKPGQRSHTWRHQGVRYVMS